MFYLTRGVILRYLTENINKCKVNKTPEFTGVFIFYKSNKLEPK
jgi:hypothetical protein